MPSPPSYQEGDTELTEVEIGQLRKALWFRSFAILTWSQLQTCEDAVDGQTEVAISLAKQNTGLKTDLTDLIVRYDRLEKITIGIGIGGAVAIIGVLTYALITN